MSSPSLPFPTSRSEIGYAWFIRLRMWAVLLVGMLGLIGLVTPFGLPVASLLALCVALGATQGLSSLARTKAGVDSGRLLGSMILIDLLLLSIFLSVSGGPSNPLSVLYLAYVSIASTLLGARWAWASVGLSVACYALLFLVAPVDGCGHCQTGAADGRGLDVSSHLWGMFVAFAAAATIMAYFMTRLTQALRAREDELDKARSRIARTERHAAVMGLAAGTTHELATPLGTIALAASELEREASKRGDFARIQDDARLIRGEVERCAGLLSQLRAHAGDLTGELPVALSRDELVGLVTQAVPSADSGRVTVGATLGFAGARLPPRAFAQVAGSLIRNALEATVGECPVEVRLERAGEAFRFRVEDHGRGMSEEQQRCACEPFFTTKSPSFGHGLGLFLADRFASALGGELRLSSVVGVGTTVVLEVPA